MKRTLLVFFVYVVLSSLIFGQNVSVVGKNLKLSDVLSLLSQKSKISYIMPKSLDTKIDLNINDVDVDSVLSSICISLNYKLLKNKNVYIISWIPDNNKCTEKICEHVGKSKRKKKILKTKKIFNTDKKSVNFESEIIYNSTPMSEYVSIDVKNYDVRKLFELISNQSGIKIIVAPRVNGRVDYKVTGKYYKNVVKEIAKFIGARVIESKLGLSVIK